MAPVDERVLGLSVSLVYMVVVGILALVSCSRLDP
jgi:hypothetical protein